jgi:hypothetical protein
MSTPGGNSSWLRHVSTTRGNKLIWFNAVTGEYVEDTGQDRDALPKLKLPSASTRIDVGSMLNISRATLNTSKYQECFDKAKHRWRS